MRKVGADSFWQRTPSSFLPLTTFFPLLHLLLLLAAGGQSPISQKTPAPALQISHSHHRKYHYHHPSPRPQSTSDSAISTISTRTPQLNASTPSPTLHTSPLTKSPTWLSTSNAPLDLAHTSRTSLLTSPPTSPLYYPAVEQAVTSSPASSIPGTALSSPHPPRYSWRSS